MGIYTRCLTDFRSLEFADADACITEQTGKGVFDSSSRILLPYVTSVVRGAYLHPILLICYRYTSLSISRAQQMDARITSCRTPRSVRTLPLLLHFLLLRCLLSSYTITIRQPATVLRCEPTETNKRNTLITLLLRNLLHDVIIHQRT